MAMTVNATSPRRRFILMGVRLLLAFAFIMAGGAKLVGLPMMVSVFEHVGFGQWFRYVTGVIEVSGAILLLTSRFAGPAGLVLATTMAGAILAHLTVVPGSPGPAILLLVLSAIIAWAFRDQTRALVSPVQSGPVAS